MNITSLPSGDRARIIEAKRTFEKGYLPNCTTRFTNSRKMSGRTVYRIKGGNGEN